MEHPRTRGTSVETLLGSCSSRNGSNGDNTSRTTSFDRPLQERAQESSSSHALGHAMGRYLNQALQGEPWSPAVKAEKTGKVSNQQRPDRSPREAEDRKD